jgi:hypothetical protein
MIRNKPHPGCSYQHLQYSYPAASQCFSQTPQKADQDKIDCLHGVPTTFPIRPVLTMMRDLRGVPCFAATALASSRTTRSTRSRSDSRSCTAQHSTAQHSTAQHSTAQHSTAQHSTAQHSTAQHSTAQHSTARHGTASQQRQHVTWCLLFL